MPHQRPAFSITKKLPRTQARLGVLRTTHGTIRTPAYVIVATHAAIRTLKPADIPKTGTQMVIANTYHLWRESEKLKGRMTNLESRPSTFLIRKLGISMPTMTDSGGFQVFSLGAAKDHAVGKVLRRADSRKLKVKSQSKVKITEKGAYFAVDGEKRFISPESSITAQQELGADIIFAFDECTSPLHPFAYQKQSMERTHRWARRCLLAHTKKDQFLFGIVQGGRFKSLRAASAKALANMAFDGYGIGGSFGEDGMATTLSWITPHLPDEKPRHLLGIGSVRDIFTAVEAGMDTFDCVIPTREARHAKIYTDTGPLDIRKGKYARDRKWKKLHLLFKRGDPEAGRLATIHNVTWFNRLLKNIRTALADGSYPRFKKEFLKRFATRS